MNVDLTYKSGQQYSESLSNVDAKVVRSRHGSKRVRLSFREKEDGSGRLSFSLPSKKAKQLAYAILTACADDNVQPIEFGVEEAPANKEAAA